MKTQRQESHIPQDVQLQAADLIPGDGAETPAVYLQSPRRSLRERHDKQHHQSVRGPGRGLREQPGQQVESQQYLQVRQGVRRDAHEPLGQVQSVRADGGSEGAGVQGLGHARKQEYPAEYEPGQQVA